jgi:transposase-like protein
MIRRMVGPTGVTATQLSKETGVSQPTLSKWLLDADKILPNAPKLVAIGGGDPPSVSAQTVARRRPADWSAEEKLRVLVESSQLRESELGGFLRSRGLHEGDLKAWRGAVIEALGAPRRKASTRSGVPSEGKRIRTLERELQRKEKALAEAAALLILKKKLETLFGSEDEDESTKK